MPRGGRRPGAGAPRGNLNAVKHGLESIQVKSALRAGSLQQWKFILDKMNKVKDRRSYSGKQSKV